MKKPCFLSVLIVFATTCAAQSQFGFFAGGQSTTSKYTVNIRQPTQYKYGFHAGIGWKIPFENKLFFSPAIFYSLKGYKVTLNNMVFPPDTAATDNNTTIHTAEVAFLLQVDLGKGANHVFIKAGPSLDFQLFGREKFGLKGGGFVDRKIFFDFGSYGRYAANLLMQLGYESKRGFVAYAQYTLGVISINNADFGPRIYHRAFGVSFGKYFTTKKAAARARP